MDKEFNPLYPKSELSSYTFLPQISRYKMKPIGFLCKYFSLENVAGTAYAVPATFFCEIFA